MDVTVRITDKRKSASDAENEDDFEFKPNTSSTAMMASPRNGVLDQDKRVRREIANSNERRRMQSINAGFQSLRTLLPHQNGEKMSKAGILQQGADYIQSLESDKTRLLSQNAQLKQVMRDMTKRLNGGGAGAGSDSEMSSNSSPPPKRKKRDTESSDEGIAGMGYIEDTGIDDLKREMIELRNQLDRERRLRMKLEEEQRSMEAQLYPERIRQIVAQVQHCQQQEGQEPPPPPPPPCDPLPAAAVSASKVDTRSMPPPPEPMETSDHHKVRMHYAEQQRHLQEQQERRMEHEKPLEPRPVPPLNSSMSRRNLETIVEAIRHLEGDGVLQSTDNKPEGTTTAAPTMGRVRHPHHKIVRHPHHKITIPRPVVEESLSEKESSGSDMDDCNSSSGRNSPLCLTVNSHATTTATVTTVARPVLPDSHGVVPSAAATATFVSLPSFVPVATTADRYPIAMHLLHQAGLPAVIRTSHLATTSAPAATLPGVVVQKSS